MSIPIEVEEFNSESTEVSGILPEVKSGEEGVNSQGQGLGARTQVPQASQSQPVVTAMTSISIAKNSRGSGADGDSNSTDVHAAYNWSVTLHDVTGDYISDFDTD